MFIVLVAAATVFVLLFLLSDVALLISITVVAVVAVVPGVCYCQRLIMIVLVSYDTLIRHLVMSHLFRQQQLFIVTSGHDHHLLLLLLFLLLLLLLLLLLQLRLLLLRLLLLFLLLSLLMVMTKGFSYTAADEASPYGC